MTLKIELLKGGVQSRKSDSVAVATTAASKTARGLKRLDSGTQKELTPIDRATHGAIASAVERFDFKGNARTGLDVQLSGKQGPAHVRLFGMPKKATLEDWRRFGADAVQSAQRHKSSSLLIALPPVGKDLLPSVLEALAEGVHLSQYQFARYRKADAKSSLKKVLIAISSSADKSCKEALKAARVSADAVTYARDWVNAGPSDHTPTEFVKMARKLSSKHRRLRLQILNEKQLKRMGANALLAVARGSSEKPYLLHLKLAGKSRKARKVLLVGKGVTFDSGGLSIKTGKGMEEMKCDMAGAAAVLATMSALAARPELSGGHEVHALIPTCENMINGKSVKPGDVVRALSGKTIEILNTDAEGRLILADALCYGARFKPEYVIDLATLTGACVVALGSDYAGLFTDDDKLASRLEQAGSDAGENLWRLPLAKEYRRELNSPIADLKNIGSGGPGAITAALFLKEFVPENTTWAHLDIAGPAFVGKSNEYTPAGGTGFGVRTLIRFLQGLQ